MMISATAKKKTISNLIGRGFLPLCLLLLVVTGSLFLGWLISLRGAAFFNRSNHIGIIKR